MILVADDDQAFLETVDAALGAAGFRVLLADTCERAIAIGTVLRDEIRVALVDFDMPGAGGLEVIRELRDHAPRMRIIGVSGVARCHVLEVARYLGADCTLQKPYNPRWLDIIRELRAAA